MRILASVFSPGETALIVVLAVLLALLIALNIVLIYLFNKRGERKLYDKLLQQQRELLMRQLEEMRATGTVVYMKGEQTEPEAKEEAAEEEVVEAKAEETKEEPAEEELPEEPAPTLPDEGEEEEESEDVDDVVISDSDDDDGDSEEFIIGGNKVRYNRSFTARITQADDALKIRYSVLKNYILSYKKVRSRISWKRETFRLGRNTFASFVVRGKTLCLCLATDPKRFEETKYNVYDLSVRSPKNKLPSLFRIKSNRGVKYATELIDLIMSELGAERTEGYKAVNYTLRYQTTEKLIQLGLIKVITAPEVWEKTGGEEVAEPKETTEEKLPEEPAPALLNEDEEEEETDDIDDIAISDSDDDDGDSEEFVIGGNKVRYNRSFTARITQADDALKIRYSVLKNHILSYKKVRSRISWKRETFRLGRNTFASFVVRGKTLCLCLATDPKRFAESKYNVYDLSVRSPKNKLPCLFRVKSNRGVKYATELIDLIMSELGVERTEGYKDENYALRYQTTEKLIQLGLIKIVNGSMPEIAAETAVDFAAEDAAAAEKGIRYNRSFTARLIQSGDTIQRYYAELKNLLLSYKGVRGRISWKRENFNRGRSCMASIAMRGKTLCLFLATDPAQFAGTKYNVEDFSLRSKKTKTPLMYRVKSDRKLSYAKQLIEKVFADAELVKTERAAEDYSLPFASTDELVERGLVKVTEGVLRFPPRKQTEQQ